MSNLNKFLQECRELSANAPAMEKFVVPPHVFNKLVQAVEALSNMCEAISTGNPAILDKNFLLKGRTFMDGAKQALSRVEEILK